MKVFFYENGNHFKVNNETSISLLNMIAADQYYWCIQVEVISHSDSFGCAKTKTNWWVC